MAKYICIDTCDFVDCCVLESEEKDKAMKSLEVLFQKIDNGEIILLLPEVVQLEFSKSLNSRVNDIKKTAETLKKDITAQKKQGGNYQSFTPKMVVDINEKIDSFIGDRSANVKNATEIIEKIFNNKNTIKLPLDSDSILNAYKCFLSGKKPISYDKLKDVAIQSDCLTIDLLERYLKTQTDYEFLFCSRNINDFADSTEISDPAIHKDIGARFPSIKYYTNILKLLNVEFGTNFAPELIEKLKEEPQKIIEDTLASSIGLEASNQTESPEKLTDKQ